MTVPVPPGPPPPGPLPAPDTEGFSRGSVLPGAVAGCALPVVGVLLALLLGLGLVVWSGVREDDGLSEDTVGDVSSAGRGAAAQASVSADR